MLFHRTITLDGTTQNVKTASALADKDDIPLTTVTFQADGGNAAPCFVGGSNLTDTVFMLSLPIGAAGVPAPPIIIPCAIRFVKPSQIWVRGTVGQKINVGGVPQ